MLKQDLELLKKQKNSDKVIITPIRPKSDRVRWCYNKVLKYYKSVVDTYDSKTSGYMKYYYIKLLHIITLYFYGAIFLFHKYRLEKENYPDDEAGY